MAECMDWFGVISTKEIFMGILVVNKNGYSINVLIIKGRCCEVLGKELLLVIVRVCLYDPSLIRMIFAEVLEQSFLEVFFSANVFATSDV